MARPPHGYASAVDAASSSGTGAVVFTLFVVAGAAYIILAKLEGMAQIFVTFVPVAIMIAYATLIWLARGLRLRDDQAGDNLYYMGFLFTLTSLSVSLYQFNASGAAEEIVKNFGIAIGSTITGIALRVFFNQMRQDPVEVERLARLELAEAARRVRRELDSTVVEFGYVRRSAQQAAADSFSAVAEKFDHIAANFLGSLAEVASKSGGPFEAASRRSVDLVEQLTNTLGSALSASTRQLRADIETLSRSAGEISAALDVVTTKLGIMRTPEAVIEVRLQPVVQSLTEAIDRFAAQSERQAAAIRDVVGAAKIAAESSSVSIIALRQEITANSAANGATLERATAIMTTMAQFLDEFEADAKAQVDVLRHALQRTDATMRDFADLILKSGSDMAVQTDGLRNTLPAMQAGAESLATARERTADIAEDLDARRAAPTWETAG
jgi:hypothetical protein